MNRSRWMAAAVVVGAVAAHRFSAADSPPARPAAPVATTLPPELAALNTRSRGLYQAGRAVAASETPVVVVSGDDLVLRRNGTRTVVTVIPAEYHALKSVSHVLLAVYGHLARYVDAPLPDDALTALKEYRTAVERAGPAVEGFGFDPDTLARQRRLLARGLAFIDQVLAAKRVSAAELTRYARAVRPDTQANFAAAAKAQIVGTHKQMMAWKAELSPKEWATFGVVIPGVQPARRENAAVQYFARLLGQTGEGRRIVYAESLWDEEKAVALLGTVRLDEDLSVAVFADPDRMFRDVLADGARAALDDVFAAP